MASASPVQITVRSPQLRAFGAALLQADQSKELRLALLREIRREAKPIVTDLRAAAMRLPSKGAHEGPSLRAAIAAATGTKIRFTTRQAGVSIRTKNTPNIRNFPGAPRMMNRKQWRHPVYGGTGTAVQIGKPGWFDETTAAHKPQITGGVVRAVQTTAELIAARSRAAILTKMGAI